MTIKAQLNKFNFFIATFIFLCVGLVILAVDNGKRLKEHQDLETKAISLANELQESSEKLTRMARDYVMTRDKRFKQKYSEFLDVRGGKKPRINGDTISFIQLLAQLDLTKEEQMLLNKSESNSNQLALIEMEAFRLVEGEVSDDDENRAEDLLFGEDYYIKKEEIMRPIQQFNEMVVSRIQQEINFFFWLDKVYLTLLAMAFLGLLIVVFFLVLSIRKSILVPLTTGVEVAQRIEMGDKFVTWQTDATNEIGVLAESFNNMMGSINESNEELRVAIENAMTTNAKLNSQNLALEQSAIVSITDVKGNILSANSKFSEVSKYTMDEIVGQNHRIVNSGYHNKEMWAEMYRNLANGKTWRGDIKNKAKDGTFYWVDSIMVPIFYERDKPQEYLAIRFLITEKKEAEEKLAQSQSLLQSIFDTLPVGMVMISPDGKIEAANGITESILGLSTDEHKMKNLQSESWKIVREDGSPMPVEEYPASRALAGEPLVKDVIMGVNRPDGSLVWINASAAQLTDSGSQGVVVAFEDVTERRRMLKEIEQMSMLSDNALQLTKAGFWHIDFSDPKYYHSSEKAARIFGEEPNKDFKYHLEKEWYNRIVAVDEDIAQQVAQCYEDAVEGKSERYDVVYPYKRPTNGEIAWIHAIGDVMRDEEGKATVMHGVAQDITEIKLNEVALAEAKEAAESATEAKSSFLANMSHEIRTPMNAIIGFSYLIQKTELDDKQADYIKKIESSSRSLLGIINDILDFSKIEAGKLSTENTDFDLETVFEDLANIITYKAHEKKLEVVFGIDSKVPTYLIGDPLRLGQILTNLSNNAIKFTTEGEVVISADLVKEDEQKAVLRFCVKDSGIGIEKDKVDILFESFTQADTSTSRKFGGTGLGLAISKSLVEMMDGKIWVESDLGIGSSFYFTATFMKQPEAIKPLVPSKDLRGLKVLIVDDNFAARQILANALKSFTFVVTAVSSAEEGIECLKNEKEPFELVMMDWNMPGMDGLTASELIMKDKDIPKLPVIMMVTAYGREDVIKKSEEIGLSALLIKPLRYSHLFDTIMNSFGKASRKVSVKSDFLNESSSELDQIRGANILLAEDNVINQQVATELLESAGFHVSIASNGYEAIELLKGENSFDILLMDLQMPEMGGIEATVAIRKNDAFVNLPILAMTADAMEGVEEKCLEMGMNDFIPKPINPSFLFEKLVKWIEPEKKGLHARPKASSIDFEIPNIKGLDSEGGLARVGGNSSLYIQLLKDFALNNKNILNEALQAAESGDEELAYRMIHTLKGTSGNLGLKTIYQSVVKLENEIKQEGWEGLKTIKEVNSALNPMIDNLIKSLQVNEEANERLDLKNVSFEELEALLSADDPSALDELKAIGYVAHPLYEALKDQVNAYDFENALNTLQKIRATI